MKKRGIGFLSENLGWMIIAFVTLLVILAIIGIMTGKLNSAVEYIKNLFRFGR